MVGILRHLSNHFSVAFLALRIGSNRSTMTNWQGIKISGLQVFTWIANVALFLFQRLHGTENASFISCGKVFFRNVAPA